MRIFATQRSNNDIYLASSGSLAVAEGEKALVQQLEHVMQSLFGEMIHHADRGLPYEQCVWGGTPNLRQFEAFARAALQKEEGVNSVVSLIVEKQGEVLVYRATLQTVFGEVTING